LDPGVDEVEGGGHGVIRLEQDDEEGDGEDGEDGDAQDAFNGHGGSPRGDALYLAGAAESGPVCGHTGH
jgi:hypothetical protein